LKQVDLQKSRKSLNKLNKRPSIFIAQVYFLYPNRFCKTSSMFQMLLYCG